MQKALNSRRLDSIFYPRNSSEQRIAVLQEYNVCEDTDNKEEKKAFDVPLFSFLFTAHPAAKKLLIESIFAAEISQTAF
jgi:hypothetical protein